MKTKNSNSLFMSVKVVVAVCLAFVLTACVSAGNLTPEDSVSSLRQRVEDVWQAKHDGNWGKVYDLSLASMDDSVSRSDVIRSGKLNVAAFSVGEIKLKENGTVADVVVAFDTVQMGFKIPGVSLHERWVLRDGQWYLDNVSNKSGNPFVKKK